VNCIEFRLCVVFKEKLKIMLKHPDYFLNFNRWFLKQSIYFQVTQCLKSKNVKKQTLKCIQMHTSDKC
jgi:hypothetical protein